MELIEELQIKSQQLDVAIKQLRRNGTAYAEAEKDYKIALRQEALKLKSEGKAITLIPLIVYGQENVALLRMKRDIAEATYKANQEAINSVKLQIRILDSQITREWGNPNA